MTPSVSSEILSETLESVCLISKIYIFFHKSSQKIVFFEHVTLLKFNHLTVKFYPQKCRQERQKITKKYKKAIFIKCCSRVELVYPGSFA